MIHISGFDELPLLQAFLAIGMLKNEASAKCLPTAAVAALCGRSPHLASACVTRRLRLGFDFGVTLGAGLRMGVAVALASRHGPVTAGVRAECEKWHGSDRRKSGDPRRVSASPRPELRVETKASKKTTLR